MIDWNLLDRMISELNILLINHESRLAVWDKLLLVFFPGGLRYSPNFWVGVCCWDPKSLTLLLSTKKSSKMILCSWLKAKKAYPVLCRILFFMENMLFIHQGPVVQRVDNFIQRINPYPVDKIGTFLVLLDVMSKFDPLDRDLSTG